jgi:hypothetical protein
LLHPSAGKILGDIHTLKRRDVKTAGGIHRELRFEKPGRIDAALEDPFFPALIIAQEGGLSFDERFI